MKILLCTNTFQNITNGPTKFANLLYNDGKLNSELEVHILTEDVNYEAERLYQCRLGSIKTVLPLAPVYRMYKYYQRAHQLHTLHKFDYIIYNNAVYGLMHALKQNNVVGMINDDNNQKNTATVSSRLKYVFIKKAIFKYWEQKAIAYAKLILTNSNYLTHLLQTAYPDHASKIVRLYKGLDLQSGNKRKSDAGWDVHNVSCIQILFVKNDFIRGGLMLLAQSLSTINLKFSLTVIGPDEASLELIESFFSAPNVSLVFLGIQKQEQVFELMSTHHIFCVPSLQEALGVANLEALNIGIPVVSSDAGGLEEVLDYGNCGFISKAGDTNSLKSSLESCIYEKELRVEKVLNGFEHVKKFRKELMISNLQRILHAAL